MLLSDSDIRNRVAAGTLTIDPFDDRFVQPASVDVRLHGDIRRFRRGCFCLNPDRDSAHLFELEQRESADAFYLWPGDFVLASTVETVTLPADLAARLEGKSSLGRLGLVVHSTAGFIDPGFSGQITLELSSVVPVPLMLRVGMLIGQLSFTQLLGPATELYGSPRLGSKYQDQRGPTPARPRGGS